MGVVNEVKAVFLDRDGVINEPVIRNRKPYPPLNLDEVKIIDGVKDGLNKLRKLNYLLIVVSNQPDVARGSVSRESVEEINGHIAKILELDDILCCFHDDRDNCSCRKPKPGMILEASLKWKIDLSKSFIVGDRWRDIEAGKNAYVRTIMIDYDYDERKCDPDYICNDFKEVVEIIKKLNIE